MSIFCNSVLFGLPHHATPVCSERCCTAHLQNPTIRAYYSRAHHPSLAARPRAHLLQIGSPDVPISPRHFTSLPTVMFPPCRQHDIKTTAAVFCLSSSKSTARSTLQSANGRSHAVAGANMWNDLLFHITSVQSLAVFRQRLKTFLFSRSYPDILI